MERWDFINNIIERKGFTKYLEIGTYHYESYDHINCQSKTGVDSDPLPIGSRNIMKMTSDDFFAMNTNKFQTVFIDGNHLSEQVARDIVNSYNCLEIGGFLVLHDCLPLNEAHASREWHGQPCSGDVYKAIVWFKDNFPNILCKVLNFVHGIGIIHKTDAAPIANNYELSSYTDLDYKWLTQNMHRLDVVDTSWLSTYLGKNKRRVLIGLLCHNFAKYIAECIESALNQTYPCTVFVSDDGSTDGSQDIIKKYRDKIIMKLHEDNSGDQLRAGNEIIAMACSGFDYLHMLSGDDAFYPNAIELLVDSAEETKCDWIYGGLDLINSDGIKIGAWCYEGHVESVPAVIAHMWRTKSNGISLSSLIRSKFLVGKKMSRFPSTTFSIDASTNIDWMLSWPYIRRLRHQVIRYRQHDGSETNNTPGEVWEKMHNDCANKMIATFGYENIMACMR
jgi:hypothetical protein